jgi:hypothetical protein
MLSALPSIIAVVFHRRMFTATNAGGVVGAGSFAVRVAGCVQTRLRLNTTRPPTPEACLDGRPANNGGERETMVTVVQPIEYVPVAVDVCTAIERIVDHYFYDEQNDYLSNGSEHEHEHVFVWLTVLSRWLPDCQKHGSGANVKQMAVGNRVCSSIEHVVCCLRQCDLDGVAKQAWKYGTAKALKESVDEIQEWLEFNDIDGLPQQYTTDRKT